MCSIYIDPAGLPDPAGVLAEADALVDWGKASPPAAAGGEVLVPGDIERRTREQRLREGIPLDDTTRGEIRATAQSVGVAADEIARARLTDQTRPRAAARMRSIGRSSHWL